MKHKALQEPKPCKAFWDKYLAALMMVAALLISFAASAQTDSLKYSQINGYGFKYKRMAFDSVLMAPLSTSPYVPYRKGGIRYNPGDSTLQVWTGYQWRSIVANGSGIDTAFAYDDTTLVIITPSESFFVSLKGKLFGVDDNTATANRHFTFYGYQSKIDSFSQYSLYSRVNPSGVDKGIRSEFNLGTDFIYLRNYPNNGVTPRAYGFGAYQTLTEMYAVGHVSGHTGFVQADTSQVILESDPNRLYMYHDSVTITNFNNLPLTLRIRPLPSTIDTTNYKPAAIGPNGQMKIMSGWPGSGSSTSLNNVGPGYRLATTPNGSVKSLVFGYGINGDSTTNANSITVVADTSELVTPSDLNDAIAGATGGGSDEFNIINYGAVGDGVTDCTNAFNATIDAAAAVNGRVYIPAGTFLIRSSYRDTAVVYRPKGIILKSNITMKGAGRDRSIIKLSPPPASGSFVIDNVVTHEYTTNCAFWNIITGTNVSNVVLKDFSINGNIEAQINIGSNPYHTPQNGWDDSVQTNGIQFINGNNNRIENIKLDSTVGYGMWYDSSTNGNIDRVEVTTCYNGGIYYTPGADGNSLTNSLITNNYCDNVRIKSSNITILNNETSWVKFNPEPSLANFTGIYVENLPGSWTGIKIIGNYSHDNSAFGIDMWNANDTVNSTYPGPSVLVMGNTVAYNSNGGIEVAIPNVTIANNLIYNNGANSLGVTDYDFYRPYGINITYTTSTTKGVNITGNTIRDTRGYQTYAVGNGPDLTVATQLNFSNNTCSGGLGMFEPGSVSTAVPGSMLLGNTYRTGETEQEAPSYINNPLTVVTGSALEGITVKGNAAPAFWLNNNTSRMAALGLATSAEVWQKQTQNNDVALWNEGRGILLGTAGYGDSAEVEIRNRKISIKDTLLIHPSGRGNPTGNGLLFYNLSGVANASRSILYPDGSGNAGTNINIIPRGTGTSSTDKSSLHFFNSDVLSDGTNYEFLQLKAAGTDGYLWNSVSAGSGIARDFRFQFNSTDRFTIKADGNVGINDATPDSRLDIETSVNSPDGVIVTNTNAGVSSQALYRVVNNSGELAQFGIFGSNHPSLANYTTLVGTKALRLGSDQDIATGGTNTIDFITGGYSVAPAMQIKANGNMLINTTTDNSTGAKLQVNGAITTVTDSAGSPKNMAWIDTDGKIRKAAVPSGGITSINGHTGSAITVQGGTALSVDNSVPDFVTFNVTPSSWSLPHTLDAVYTTAGNTSTTETDLYSYTLPAGQLGIDGRTINFEIDGEFNDNTITAQLRLYFGGNVTLNTGAVSVSTANSKWKLRGYVMRASSSTAHVSYELQCPGLATPVFIGYSNLTSLDFTTTNVFKISAQAAGGGASNSDITAHSWQLLYKPQPQ